jgi:hypothetical protein
MTYPALNKATPDPTQTGPNAVNSARTNLMALRDAIAALGGVQGFAYSWSGGTADKPDIVLFSRTESSITEIVKVVLTWNADPSVTKAAYYYSANGGSSYDNMADSLGNFVMTVSYDGSGNVTSTSWGSTP